MFDYSLKVKIISITFFILSVSFIFWAIRDHRQKAEDLNTVYNIHLMATALENYYAKFNAYPVSPSVAVSNVHIISNQGINEEGDYVFFKGSLTFENEAYLTSQENQYLFEFTLSKKWDIWGIDGREGGVCQMINALQITCENRPATFLDYFR